MEGVNPDPDQDQLSVAVLEVLRRVQVHDGEGLAARGGCRMSEDIKWVRVPGTTCALLLKLTPPPQPCSVEVRGTRSLVLPERRTDATRSLPRRASSTEIARRPPGDPLEQSVCSAPGLSALLSLGLATVAGWVILAATSSACRRPPS